MKTKSAPPFLSNLAFSPWLGVREQPYVYWGRHSSQPTYFPSVLVPSLAILFVFLTASVALSQPPAKQSENLAITDSARASKESLAAVKKKQAVDNVRGFADLIASFKDGATKAQALAELADLLWEYDQPYSRHLFTNAIDLIRPESNASVSDVQTLSRLRSEIIGRIAKRDADLAKRLMDEDVSVADIEAANKSRTNFQIAYDAAKTDPDLSVEFARRSLESGIQQSMSFLLVKLRATNPAAANELFLLTLQRLYAEPAIDADVLAALGTYIFTSPNLPPNLPPGTINYVGVGSILVADITADQPNIPQQLVFEYLKTAAGSLARPLPTSEQRAKMYALGYLLLQKAYQHAPEFTSPISAAMQSLSQDVPQEMTKDETYKDIGSTSKKDLTDVLSDIEKQADSSFRDAQYLALVYDLCRQFDFATAAKIDEKISDVDVREKLLTIIRFGKGARLLEKDRSAIAEAESVCASMPSGVERALLRLGIVSARARNGDSQRLMEALNEAAIDINKADAQHRPYLLISLAGLSAGFAPTLAPSILSDAMKQFKSQQGSEVDVAWKERVETGHLWREFPLRVKGISFDLSDPLRALVKLDPQGTVYSVRTLNNEELLARMLPALASGMLH